MSVDETEAAAPSEDRASGGEAAGAPAGVVQGLVSPESPLKAILLPLLAFFTALVIGAILIVFSDADVLSKWSSFFSGPGDALSSSWHAVYNAYSALFAGSLGSKYALSETVVQATPLISASPGPLKKELH